MADQEEQLTQFTDITGASVERAQFFLALSNWNLEIALASFFETGEDEEPVVIDDNMDSDDDNVPNISTSMPVLDDSPDVNFSSRKEDKKPKRAPTKAKFSTIHTMNQDEPSDDEEQGQAFYAGGSQTSGQQVLGPPPKRNPLKDYVSEVFRSAQESGGEVIDPRSVPSGSGSSAFVGTGHRLGQTTNDHVMIEDKNARPSRPQCVKVLKLWRQGFSINDGELRLYDDPTNKEFLQSVMRGEIPDELRQQSGGGIVHVDLEDHRNEEFSKGAVKTQAFGGSGHTLGSPAPNITQNIPVQTPKVETDPKADEKKANDALKTDSSQPSTMIQVRLADGSRLSTRFNHSHTVDDIRQFIINARPQYVSREFMLLTTFPNKELTTGTDTIEKAGLLNAAILQRLK